MRALDVGTRVELTARHPGGSVDAAGRYPLPDARLTEPGLLMTPHRDAARLAGSAVVANYEET